MKAAVPSSAVSPPFTLSRKSATTGKTRLASWFQTPVSVIARVTSAERKPQARSIPQEPAIPTAAPPGAMIESAVDACVTTNACRKRRPGQRHHPGRREGGEVEHRRRDQDDPHSQVRVCDDGPDIPVVRDLRQEEGEGADHDRSADTGERVALASRPASSCAAPALRRGFRRCSCRHATASVGR